MKGYILVSTLLVILLSLSTPVSSAGERVYTFDDMDAWEVITGKWEVKDGEFYSTGSTNSMCGIALLKEEEGVRTEELEYIAVKGYDLGTGAWQNLFIIFGYNEKEAQYYLAGPFVGGRQKWAFDPIDIKTHKRGGELAGAADKLAPKVWYNVKVVFEGDTAILYGGEEGKKLEKRTSYTFPGGIPKGRVGLGASNSENKFDDFVVAGPGISPLAVQPHGKLAALWGKLKEIR